MSCTCGSSVPSLAGFGRHRKAVPVIFSRSMLLFLGKRYGLLKEAFERAEHVSAVIALHDLIDIYPIYERLRQAMFQVAYILSLCRTSISSAGDGFLFARYEIPQYFITRFCGRFQNESDDTNIMRNSRHANRQPPAPVGEIHSTFMLRPEPDLPLDAPANSGSNAK